MSDVMRLITETARDNSGIIGVWDINSLKAEALAQLRQRHEREFVYARDFDALLDALARQQEANARLTEQNDALQEAAGESCHVCEYEWDNEWATVSTDRARSVVCAKCWDGSTALARAVKAEAALADRDATIARLRDELVKEELLHDEQLRRALTAKDAEIARQREALGDADRDIHEWMRLARRQMVELPDWEHLPCGPTSAGLAESGAVRLRIREALTPAKEADRG
jgi:hypothetical protein